MLAKTKKPRGETPHVNFRLGPDTLADLDAIVKRIAHQLGRPATRADAVRCAARAMASRLEELIELEPAAKRK